MKKIADLLDLRPKEVVSICGCGGKTTLMWGLARHYEHERVLVSTSTKIGRPSRDKYDRLTEAENISALLPPASIAPGVHLAGTLHEDKTHVTSLPLSDLEAIIPGFDKTFIEADGSRLLPVKGWDKHEPVIPPYTTLTIGVATIWAEGRSIDENTVHRPHIFCLLAGAHMGENLTLAHMAAATAHPEGLMARAIGRKILFINQLDDEAALDKARDFTALLPASFLHDMDMIVGGSAKLGSASLLYSR